MRNIQLFQDFNFNLALKFTKKRFAKNINYFLIGLITAFITTTKAYAGLESFQGNLNNNQVNLKDKSNKESKISGDFSVGINDTSGNTDTEGVSLNGKINKQFKNSLWENKANLSYSSANGKMNEQKWLAFSGYSVNFGENNKWFSNYQATVDHDRFANIKYRALPSIGIGYWFSHQENYILKSSLGIGYQVIEFRESDPESEEETAALISDSYFKKQVFEKSFISQSLIIIPSFKFSAGTRCKSISAFTNTINSKLSLEVKYTIDYDSEPSINATTTDKELIFGIKYKF